MKQCLIQLLVLGTLAGMTVTSIVLANKDPETLTPLEAWLFDDGVALIGGTLLGAVVLGVVLTAIRKQRRADAAWAAFATDHGLAPEPGSDRRWSGSVGGRVLRVRVWTTGGTRSNGIGPTRTDTGGGATFEELHLELPGVPPGLVVGPQRDLGRLMFHGLRKLVGAPEAAPPLTCGDAAFDAQATVEAAEPDAARAWLTAARRQALLELLEGAGDLRDGGLRHAQQGRSEQREALEARLDWLRGLAARLETAG